MSFTRKHFLSDFSYYINNNPVSVVTSFKYLGVTLTTNLSWTTHINNICGNASRSLGYLRRNLRKTPTNVRKLAYLTFVRPKLEFASSIWSPHYIYLTTMLESVQNRAARFISQNYNWNESITQIKNNLSIPSLNTRRDVALILLFHKYVHGPRPSPIALQVSPFTSRRLHNHLSFTRIYGKTDAFNSSALPRVIRLWNDLPDILVAEANKEITT